MVVPNQDNKKQLIVPEVIAASQLPQPGGDDEEIPLEAEVVGASDQQLRYRNMLASVLTVNPAAKGNWSTLACDDLGDAAMKNQLGTRRPLRVVVALNPTREFMYIIPVASDYDGGHEIIWDGTRASASLYKTLAAVDRLVPDGMRDLYPLKPTPGPVSVGTLKGYGLYCKLTKVWSERMGTLSEETKAKREATRKRNLEKKRKSGQDATNP